MGNKKYTEKDHERAWEIYFEHRTYQSVADQMGVDYATVTRWSKDDYKCKYAGCAWHGWDRMIEERDMVVTARLNLYEEGNLNPAAHDNALREAILSGPAHRDLASVSEEERRRRLIEVDRRKKILETLVRSDFERLAQWELIWSKIIFQLTGQVLDVKVLVDSEGDPLDEEEIRKILGRGLKSTTLEGAVRSLKEVQDQVDKLKERLGVQKKVANEDIGPQTEASDEHAELTIEDMRQFKDLLDNTPPDKKELLIRMFKADQRFLDVAAE